MKSGSKTSRRLSVATSSQYNMLQEKVSQLEEQLSDTMPKNKELLQKTQRGSKSVSEMWQMMNMVARMDAAEQGIEKLTTIIEDLAVECNKIGNELGIAPSGDDDGEGRPRKARGHGSGLQGSTSILGLIDGIMDDFDVLKDEVKELNDVFQSFKSAIPEELVDPAGSGLQMNRISGIDVKFCEVNEMITRLDNAFNNQMNIFQDQVTDIEKEVMGIWENINNKAAAEARSSGTGEILTKITVIQEELENVGGKISKLNDDKDEKTLRINVITEEIEILKTVKADRREVEDLLEEKADITLVNTKLSIVQFDIAYGNMTESLNEAHTKLTNQEITLRNSLEEMHTEVELKLYREELTPVRESLTDKIRKLHERLKIIENAKKEAEAAGTKAKYLKDVNCISCDNKVLMARVEDMPTFPSFKPMPQHTSMQPFLSYDMDNVRKCQKLAAGQETDMGRADVSVCNRYCGGSHTMTTAQQRVRRGGNFTAQFAMQALPIRPPGARRPSTAPEMRDQAIMAHVSEEFREQAMVARRSLAPEGTLAPPAGEGASVGRKSKTSKGSLVEGGKPPSAASLKDGEKAKSRSQTGSQKGSAQKVAAEGGSQAGDVEKPASGTAITSKPPSAEKVASAAGSATKQASGEQVADEAAPPDEAPPEEAPAEDAPAEEAPGEEAPAEEAPAEEGPAEEAAPAEE